MIMSYKFLFSIHKFFLNIEFNKIFGVKIIINIILNA